MSEDYLAPKPIAMWNTVRGVWEKPGRGSLLCEHSELFSEAWPTWGSMRSGMVWKPRMPERPTEDSEFSSLPAGGLPTPVTTDHASAASDYGVEGFRQLRDIHNILGGFYDSRQMPLLETITTNETIRSDRFRGNANPTPAEFVQEMSLLRTPAASEGERGHQPEEKARARGGQVTLSGQLNYLPTTRAQHGEDRNNTIYARPIGKPQNLENALANLPTLTVADTFTDQLKSSQQKEGSMHSVNLSQAVHMTWGRFEPAVRRWEAIIGYPAPKPTEPTGKDGAPRLSSKFTEWMMGLEPGWITGVGLSRKDELKACGNGVVPQQAMLALKMLKARFEVE